MVKNPINYLVLGGLFLLNGTFSYYYEKLLEHFDPKGDQLMVYIPEWTTVVGVFCIVIAAFLWWHSHSKSKTKTSQEHVVPDASPMPEVEHIYSTHFTSQIIKIDNKHFHDCIFENVMFEWAGGSYFFTNVTLVPPTGIKTAHPMASETLSLLKFLGLLEPDFAKNLRDIPA